jgi:hypothetical protein
MVQIFCKLKFPNNVTRKRQVSIRYLGVKMY